MSAPILRIAVALIVNSRGETLVVRKAGTALFLQPGRQDRAGRDAG